MRTEEPLVQERGIRRRRTRGQRLIALFVVVALVGIVGAAWLLLRPRQQGFTLSSYTYAAVRRGDLRQTLEVSGTMDVKQQEDVVALQHGFLSAIAVSKGDRVKKGQVLGRLEAKDLEDQLSQSQSDQARLQRDLERLGVTNRFSEKDYERARPGLLRAVDEAARSSADTARLAELGGATRRDLSAAQDREAAARDALAKADSDRQQAQALYELAVRNSEADIEQMTATIRRLQESIDECTIAAPFDATVMDIYPQTGDYISQYQKLFHLADTEKPRVVLDVPEDAVAAVAAGQSVSVLLTNGTFEGTVERIGLEAQVSSSGSAATVPVDVTFDRPPASVIPGSSASAEITLGVKRGTLILPRAAFLSTGEQRYVYRISGNRAVKTPVAYGVIQTTEVEVLSGLSEGDRVITSGYSDYIDRDEIQLRLDGGKAQ